jgi:hypothetical protein
VHHLIAKGGGRLSDEKKGSDLRKENWLDRSVVQIQFDVDLVVIEEH